MANSRDFSLAFMAFCLLTAVMILRPGEMLAGLEGVPIYEGLIFTTLALSFRRVMQFFTPNALCSQPITLCLVGVFVAIPLSHLTHSYFGGMLESTIEFTKAALFYALLVATVDTWERFEKLCVVIAVCATTTVALCVIDFVGLVDFEFIKHINDSHGVTETGETAHVLRMNGTGIFSDPNDISLLIVATGVLCVSFLWDRERSQSRLLWLGPLAVLVTGLFCTKSRGGLLALGAACGVMIMFRYGKQVAIAIGLLGAVAVPLLAGRQAEIDISDGTGHDRILLWRDGLAAVMSSDIVFGTGHRTYQDLAGLVAHNSFVHAFVELGLFGGTFFFGLFFFSALGLFRLNEPQWRIQHPRQARFLPFMAAIGAGWTIGLFSLSRCYTVSTLLILGLGTAYLNLANWNIQPRRLVLQWDRTHRRQLVLASAALFVGLNVFVRVVG